jgi:hypothetical protein
MKIILSLILLLSTCLSAQELIKNGTFAENPPDYGALPPAWQLDQPDSQAWGFVNDDGMNSAEALRCRLQPGKITGTVSQKITCQANQNYILRADLKSSTALPQVQVLNADGKVLTSLSAQKETPGVWQEFSQTFTTVKDTNLTVRLSATGDAGTVFFDNLSLRPGQAAAQATPTGSIAPRPFVAPGPNIALGKPYTMSRAPNYALCRDAGDATQLTDGIYTKGYFWTQKSTVGWSNAFLHTITIDLGKTEPICGVSWNAAAGTAGVTWPSLLSLYVSEDAENWYFLGDIFEQSIAQYGRPPEDKYSVYRIASTSLASKGRYVCFQIFQNQYCFVDEIEVYRGADSLLDQPAGQEVIPSPKTHYWAQCLQGRLLEDFRTISEALQALPDSADKNAALAKLPGVEKSLQKLQYHDLAQFLTVIPMVPEQADIFALHAAVLRAKGFPKPAFWRNNRWENLSPLAIPPPESPQPLQVEMMRGEVRAESVNILNPSGQELTFLVTVSGLPAGSGLDLREVVFTDTRQLQTVSSALRPGQGESLTLSVPAGSSRQVWLSFNRPSLKAGQYPAVVSASAAGQETLTIPLNLVVHDLDFPAAPRLHVGGWDYLNGKTSRYNPSGGDIEANLAMMREIYVDSPWATNSVVPRGAKFGPNGALLNARELDFQEWDAWVKRFSGARNYCVYWAVNDNFQREPAGTERFNRMVGDYITVWVDHLRQNGLRPEQLVLLLVDEPSSPVRDSIIIPWAKAINAAQPETVIFEDPIHSEPEKGLQEMFESCDVLCPNTVHLVSRGQALRDFYVRQREAGRTLWLYSCSGPARLLDPVSYYRAQMWQCFHWQAKGAFYWALGCGGGTADSWHAYNQSGTEYSPFFVSPDGSMTMSAKQSEGIREGVQDYEYLCLLQERIAALRNTTRNRNLLGQAEELLAGAATRVLESLKPAGAGSEDYYSIHWNDPKDRDSMDKVRIEVLRMLSALK